MLKSRINKGNGLIEIIISILMFFFMINFIIKIELNNYKLQKSNKLMNDYLLFFEGIKNEIKYNYDYEDIKQLMLSKKMIINSDNINMKKLKENNLYQIFSVTRKDELPYLKLKIVEDNKVLEINLELCFKTINRTKTIETKVYKGDIR